MANERIRKYSDMVTLQIASEAFLDGETNYALIEDALTLGNKANSKLPELLLGQFTPDNELSHRFTVIAHREMTLRTNHSGQADRESGFSGTLFYDGERDEFTFSIRSTEFSADIHDAGDIYADLEIADRGWAFGQIYDMEGFWNYLNGTEYLQGESGITTQDSALLDEFRTHMSSGGTINVTGYSLGGNLAQAFTALHPNEVEATYLFNSAGTGSSDVSLSSVWSQFLTTFNDPASTLPYFWLMPLTAMTSAIATSQLGNYPSLPEHASFFDTRYLHAVTEISSLVTGAAFSFWGRTNPNSDQITDIWASNGPRDSWFDTLVADSGVRHGKAQPVWHEDQPATYWGNQGAEDYPNSNWGTGHSIVLLQDSLSLMALFEEIQPDITIEELSEIFEMGSNRQYDSLERILNSLAQIVGIDPLDSAQIQPTDIAFADMAYRNAFHEKIQEVRSSELYMTLADTDNGVGASVRKTETLNIADIARTNFSTFLSLYHLSPFTLAVDQYDSLFESHVSNSILLNAWQEDSQLSAAQRAQGLQHFSDQFLDDRAFMLSTMMPVNASNNPHGNLSEASKFTDVERGASFDGDSLGHAPQVLGDNPSPPPSFYDPDRIRISFGSNEGDTFGNINLQTSENDDHLYGMGGADIISGLGGNDYIEGGEDNDNLLGGDGIDTVLGGEGNDLITGGQGDDYLYGGAGADTFYWNDGDGSDAIADYDDGGDRLIVNGIDLASVNFKQASSTSSFYSDSNHPGLTAHFDGARLTILAGTGPDAGEITLQQYNPTAGSDYGIALNSYTPTPLPSANVIVNQVGTDDTDVDWQAWWRQTHQQGQIDWTSSTINLDIAAISNYSGSTNSPVFRGILFEGGPLGDQLNGDNLNNILHGLSGNDVIRGLDGFDMLEGWKGSDTIEGGAGTDVIYGSTRINRAQSINPNDETQTFYMPHIGDEPGDINILDGGDGRDRVIGGEYRDIISGGEGDDYLWGGTGEDHISGGSGVDRILGDSSMLYVFTEGEDREIIIKAHTAFADGSDVVNQYDDFIFGGEGNDTIWGELGNDQIYGDAGDDLLFGDRALDPTFEVSPFLPYQSTDPDLADVLHGNDSLYGGIGNDYLVGQGGDDLLAGGPGFDGLWGGKGNDTYLIENGDGRNDIFDNEGGHTLVFSGIAPGSIDVVFSGESVYIGSAQDQFAISRDEWENVSIALNSPENLIERSQLDTYYEDSSGTLLLHVAGQRGITEAERNQIATIDDSNRERPTIVAGPNAGSFNADASNSDANISITGNDLASPVNITIAGAADNIDFNDISLTLAPHIVVTLTTGSSNFGGTENDDHIVGNNSDSQLNSGGGNDILDGRGGMDNLYGQAGDDILLGGDGDDILDGGSGDDVLDGGAGNDELRASLGNDRLSGGTGNDLLGSGNGYTYLFSAGDGNDVIEVDNAGGGYTKGTVEFAAEIDFNSISFSTVGVDTIIHYGNGDTLTLDMSTVLTSSDNAISRFTLTSAGNPAAVPLITESGPTNNLLGTFGSDHIIGGNLAGLILPGYGDDIIETSVNGSTIRLNTLYFKDAEGGIGHKEIHMRGAYDQVIAPVHQGISYFITSSDHYNVIEYDWSYSPVNPYDIELNGDTATFNAHGEDSIIFADGIAYEDLTFTRAGQDLEITMGTSTGELRIKQFFVAYDVDISGQQIDIPSVAADTYIPGLLTQNYVLAAMPKTAIASIHFANGMAYDLANVLADHLVTVPTLPGLTHMGTRRDDEIYGAANSNDVIQSREGHDVIEDNGGTNIIDAGAGDDTVTATGNNTVYAGPGNDLVNLSGGENFVDGGEGNDEITASGDSVVLGGAGNDKIKLTTGTHQVQAGSGDDQITISGGNSEIDTGDGIDLISLTGGSHVLRFGSSQGLKGLVIVAGSNASVVVEMAAGITPQDIIINRVDGEEGTYISIALMDGSSTLISAVLDPGTFQNLEGSALSAIHFANGTIWSELDILNLASPGEIELINGTEGPELLQGTAGRDDIKGFGGNDELRGGAGDDQLTGGSGNDIMQGNSGDDVFVVTGLASGFDVIDGGAGLDTLRGGADIDLIGLSELTPQHSLETIDGGGGAFNVVGGNDSNNTLDFSATELINILGIAGGRGNDTITGTQAGDQIWGQDGNDIITGGSGDDILQGNRGDDVFLVTSIASGFDVIDGGAGLDTLRGGAEIDLIGLSELTPRHSLETIDGGGGAYNVVGGNDSNNTLDFSATELINILAIAGGKGHDQLIGSKGDDWLLGNEGNDTLAGSLGNDTLTGATGNDTYLFALGDGHDTIRNGGTDSLAEDTLRLGGIEHDSLWLTRQGDDLLVNYVGSDDKVAVEDWYRTENAQLDDIYAASHVLQRNQVDQLVNAMAAFDIPTGVGTIIPEDTRLQLEPMLASVWQAA